MLRLLEKNDCCTTKHTIKANAGRPPVSRPKQVSWRPKTEKAKQKYLEIGGARWLNRVLEGLTR